MIFIILSALSSIGVALLLKQARIKGQDGIQLIGWNYAAALVLCLLVLQPSFKLDTYHLLPWGWLMALAVMLPLVFILYSRALDTAGVIPTEIAQRLSLVIALAAAFVVFGDNITLLKLSGICLGVLAVLMLILQRNRPHGQTSLTASAALALVLVWLGYGVIDVILKIIAFTGLAFGAALSISFCAAWVGMFLLMLYRHWRGISRFSGKHLALGLLLGSLNFANISLYIKAHQTFSDQPAVVFASMNILVVVMGTLAGAFLYKERLTPKTWTALALSLGAIGLLTLSRWSF